MVVKESGKIMLVISESLNKLSANARTGMPRTSPGMTRSVSEPKHFVIPPSSVMVYCSSGVKYFRMYSKCNGSLAKKPSRYAITSIFLS